MTVNVTAVNHAPVANDDTLAATEDTPVIYTAAQLLGNDADVDGNPLTIASVTSGTGGTAVLNGDGTVTFTPTANFNGAASFTYTATDSLATSNIATVTVNVAPVNDNPVANADAKSTNEDTPLIFAASDLVANDTDVDGDTLTVTAVNATASTRRGQPDQRQITYTPDANFNGPVIVRLYDRGRPWWHRNRHGDVSTSLRSTTIRWRTPTPSPPTKIRR